MKSHARVVVIGGGIAGCGLLYHLVKLGWRDVVLIERNELTAGSTWHAAGNTPHFETSLNLTRIQKYSTELYERLEGETGQATGFHKVGSIRIAENKDRLDQFKLLESQAKNIGLPFHVIGPNEIKAHFPFIELDGVIAGAHTPADGYVDPASTTNAMAKGARDGGAEIYRKTRVIGTTQAQDGTWIVETDKGTIRCEHVVNAAGTWARDVGKLAGLDLPIVSMEHQYLVTETIPEVKSLGREFPLLRDPGASYYLRQEGQGMLYGPYEPDGKPWAVDGIPEQFGQDLLPNDLDRVETIVEMAMKRVPVLAKAGIKRMVNGPIPHTPDGGPLIGPVAGLRNYWCLNGFSVGIAQGGGSGKYLAEWIVDGEPSIDMFEFDPRRFGPYATLDYTVDRATEVYKYMYAVTFPNEERPAGRPAKTTPIYERLKAAGAVFEARFGWERAAWFAPAGASESLTFRRNDSFPHVAAECRAVRERAGLLDLSGFSKFEVTGPGAAAFLDRLCANQPPKKSGGVVLTQMLTPKGKIECEGTIARLGSDRFYVVTAAAAQLHDRDWLERHCPERDVRIEDVTLRDGVLVLAGPKARDILTTLTRADLSNRAFPWLSAREIEVASVPVRALRCNYVGELGWELHHAFVHQARLYDAIVEAGRAHGLAHFGTRAMNSLRLEKAYRAWGTDLTLEVDPIEAGLERLVRLDGRDFIGRQALEDAKRAGHKWRLAILTVDAKDTDAPTNAPVFANGRYAGIVASGGYGHTVKASIALAYLTPPHDRPGARVEVEILGERRPAIVVEKPLYDPENARPKA
ncbi:MAG: FAD-dependent oxidoreductase [Alphaproteobacteria bacterium]